MKVDIKDVKTWIPRDIFEAYCGENSGRLLKFYDKAIEKKKQIVWSLNWFGLLFVPAWFGYRKQWNLFVTITTLISLISFAEAFFDIIIPASAFLGMFLAFGFICNGLLLTNANQEFLKLKKKGFEDTEIKELLQNKASPSIPLAIAAGVGYVAIVIGTSILADILFEYPY